MTNSWIYGPIGIDAASRTTRAGCRSVLVVVPYITAGTRLLDLIPLVEGDQRVQVFFTVPDHEGTWHGTTDFVRSHGGLVLPWEQAVHTEFDLILAASHRQTDRVHGKILVVPHGASSVRSQQVSGLTRDNLMRNGRVVPTALALTHDSELAALRLSCPEALPMAFVAGDPCFDRMMASRPLRPRYRKALGIRREQKLIMVSSTWGAHSLFGRHPDVIDRLVEEASGTSFRVAAALHPSIWMVHGHRQVRAWLGRSVSAGLRLIPPDRGWRAAVLAADCVVGDHGSVTQYAAAVGVPVVLGTFPHSHIRRGSIADVLGGHAPRLHTDRPLLNQLRRAGAEGTEALAGLLSSRPMEAGPILRAAMYRLLGLPEPPSAESPVAEPVADPVPYGGWRS